MAAGRCSEITGSEVRHSSVAHKGLPGSNPTVALVSACPTLHPGLVPKPVQALGSGRAGPCLVRPLRIGCSHFSLGPVCKKPTPQAEKDSPQKAVHPDFVYPKLLGEPLIISTEVKLYQEKQEPWEGVRVRLLGPRSSSSGSVTPGCSASVASSLGTLPDTRGYSWTVLAGAEVCGLWLKVRVMSEISPGDGE